MRLFKTTFILATLTLLALQMEAQAHPGTLVHLHGEGITLLPFALAVGVLILALRVFKSVQKRS